jgi:hypothetical protein
MSRKTRPVPRRGDRAELPSDHLAGSCGDRALVPEISVGLGDRTTVGDDTTAVEHAAEKIGHVVDLPLPGWPGQGERLPDAGYPGVTVGLDDVMALQPGPVDHMRPGRDGPPPAREVALPPVSGRFSKWPCPAEINRACLVEGDDAATATVVHIHELDAVG